MAVPRVVSRSGNDTFGGFSWNGLVDMCAMEPLHSFTPVQRVAHLSFWYMSEVNNGGHFQYFCNMEHFDHAEVVAALRLLGAPMCAEILSEAIAQFEAADLDRPRSVEEFVETEAEAAMEDLDRRYYESGDAEFNAAMQAYLDANESEFIQWVE
jgi:hypothetical protein